MPETNIEQQKQDARNQAALTGTGLLCTLTNYKLGWQEKHGVTFGAIDVFDIPGLKSSDVILLPFYLASGLGDTVLTEAKEEVKLIADTAIVIFSTVVLGITNPVLGAMQGLIGIIRYIDATEKREQGKREQELAQALSNHKKTCIEKARAIVLARMARETAQVKDEDLKDSQSFYAGIYGIENVYVKSRMRQVLNQGMTQIESNEYWETLNRLDEGEKILGEKECLTSKDYEEFKKIYAAKGINLRVNTLRAMNLLGTEMEDSSNVAEKLDALNAKAEGKRFWRC